VTFPNALKILHDIITEPRYVAAIDRVHDQVCNGPRFANALTSADLVPALAVRMLKVGDGCCRWPSRWRIFTGTNSELGSIVSWGLRPSGDQTPGSHRETGTDTLVRLLSYASTIPANVVAK